MVTCRLAKSRPGKTAKTRPLPPGRFRLKAAFFYCISAFIPGPKHYLAASFSVVF
jgi:hypothetical protein